MKTLGVEETNPLIEQVIDQLAEQPLKPLLNR
jgi:hypothetical protein